MKPGQNVRVLFFSCFGFIGLILLPFSAHAATAYVQGNAADSFGISSVSVTLSKNVTAGDVIAAGVFWDPPSVTLSAITANCVTGNFMLFNDPTGDSENTNAAQGYGVVTSSGPCTITATYSGAFGEGGIVAHEVSGVNTSNPVDSYAMQHEELPGTAANAVTSGNITTKQNGDYIFGLVVDAGRNGAAYTPGSGYTGRVTLSEWFQTEDETQATAGSIAATFTSNLGYDHPTIGIIAFQPAGAASSTSPVTPPADTQPPSVPQNLQAVAVSPSEINLTWSASTDNVGVTGYTIYRNGTKIGTTTADSYADSGLTASTAYNYNVSAYDAAGNTSAESSSVSGTTQATATVNSGAIIDPTREIDWTQAGIPGGIPNRTTICATISAATYANDTTDATAAIQNALNNCPANEVVFVPAGTYRINGSLSVPSNVTLRGAGPQQTIFDAHGSGVGVINLGTNYPNINNSVAITGGTSQGSNSITLSNTAGIIAGSYIMVTELNDPSFVTANGGGGTCTWCDGGIGWNGTRVAGQIVEVESVNGNNVVVSPGLYMTYKSALSPLATPFAASVKYAGVEDLQVYANNTGYATNFNMNEAAYSWIENVESNYTDGDHVIASWSYRSEIVNSYFHDAYLHTPGSYDSDLDLENKSSGMLVQNNILRRLHAGIMLEWGAAGNVISYNFLQGNFDGSATNVLMPAIDLHGAHPMFNLFEGNIIDGGFDADDVWGSSSDDTLFRNWIDGTTQICNPLSGRGPVTNCWWAIQANRAVQIEQNSLYNNSVGNVIGAPDQLALTHYNDGVTTLPMVPMLVATTTRSYDAATYGYTFGYGGCGGAADAGTCPGDNALPYTTMLIHGDYDYANSATTWASGLTHALPMSLYLSSKPSWFGSLAWPAIGPDIAGLNNNIPASYCYGQGLMPDCLEASFSVVVVPPATPTTTPSSIPIIVSFSANPGSVTLGQSSVLSWSVAGNPTPTISINNGIGAVTGSSLSVAPSQTTTYTLTATNASGSANAGTTITVTASGAASSTASSTTGGGVSSGGGGGGSGSSSSGSSPVTTSGGGGAGGGGSFVPPSSGTTSSLSFTSTSGMTVSQMEALVVSLEAELKTLLAEAAGTGTLQDVSTSSSVFTQNLALGSEGSEVKQLQHYLNTHGFAIRSSGPGSLGDETIYFGLATEKALADFQTSVGITPASGYFGPKTRAYMNTHE